jgi:hypothetical protein
MRPHAASVLRLQSTGGYLVIAAGEGGPLLCPTWATAGAWNQTTHINLQRYLDASYAGPIHWETALGRKGADKQPPHEPTAGTLSSRERTNVTILLLQQPSVFWNWWAQAEARNNVGIAARFLLGFGKAELPGSRLLDNFGEDVAVPILKALSLAILRQLGPKAPLS